MIYIYNIYIYIDTTFLLASDCDFPPMPPWRFQPAPWPSSPRGCGSAIPRPWRLGVALRWWKQRWHIPKTYGFIGDL